MLEELIKKYGPHLEDLRSRIYKTVLIFVIIFGIGFFCSGKVIELFIHFFQFPDVTITITSPFQFLDLAVDIGLFLACICTLPIATWNLYAFLRPAVSNKEFRALLKTIPVGIFLFILGFSYGFFVLFWGLQELAHLNTTFGLKNFWDIGLFISQLFMTGVLLGILFEFPIILSFLVKLGIIDNEFLKTKRRVAYATTIIIVSLLPPTDGFSLIVMSIPLVAMYEIMVLLTRKPKTREILLVERSS